MNLAMKINSIDQKNKIKFAHVNIEGWEKNKITCIKKLMYFQELEI
jgi:hypothetical protein